MSNINILKRSLHMLPASKARIILTNRAILRNQLLIVKKRSFISVAGILKSVLKVRYIVLGSAVGGGYHINNVCRIFCFF